MTDRTVVPNVVSGGIGFYEAGNRSNSWQYRAKATSVVDARGQHQIDYGFNYDRLTYDQINQRTGPTFTTPAGDQTATGAQIDILPDPTFGRIFRAVRANLNAARTTTQWYAAAFVEDSWHDPSYTAIGVPQFGFQGDIRFQGALGSGPLLDRPHQIKAICARLEGRLGMTSPI